jgi:hypothetical protein
MIKRSILAYILLFCLLVPSITFAADPIVVSVTALPTEIGLGAQVVLSATATNTSSHNVRIALDLVVEHDCLPNGGYVRITTIDQVTLKPNASVTISGDYQPGCLGEWTAEATAASRGNGIFVRTETEFTVH